MIKVFIMDVDGTLTDGKIYISSQGELMKAFSVKDGFGIKKLHANGITPVIMTARNSEIVTQRANELNISELIQGVHNKVKILEEVSVKYNCDFNEIAYIGDDENDLECMQVCGLSGCPADAVDSILRVSDFISEKSGGNGAVREFIDYLINSKNNLYNIHIQE